MQRILLAPKPNKSIKGQKEALVWESERIVLPFSPKENVKEIPAGRDIPHTNSGVCELKEGVTSGIKILRREPDKNRKKNEVAFAKNVPKLLPHMLPMC